MNYELDEAKLILAAWERIIDTQKHFNEMAMRVRNLAITLILAVFGAAGYSLRYSEPSMFLPICGRQVHFSVLIIFLGLVGWSALAMMDVGHFQKLLRASVEEAIRIEKLYRDHPFVGRLLGMTTHVTDVSRRLWGRDKFWGFRITASRKVLILFYGLIGLAGFIFALLIVVKLKPALGVLEGIPHDGPFLH